MMISPEMYKEACAHYSYEELIKERDKLIRSIRRFEKKKDEPSEMVIYPSPDVIYQCELLYLGELCKLMAGKYEMDEEVALGGMEN